MIILIVEAVRTMDEYAFRAEGLVERFGRTAAPTGADLAAHPGSVLGVLGPDGAGKTTAIRVLATLVRLDGGVGGFDAVREGHRVRRLRPGVLRHLPPAPAPRPPRGGRGSVRDALQRHQCQHRQE